MIPRGDTVLAITALDAVGPLLLSSEPALVWSRDGSRVLWANPAGAARLGASGFAALADRRWPEGHPLRRAVASLARALPEAGTLARLRLTEDAAGLPVACRCRYVRAGAERGVLVTPLEGKGRTPSLDDLAAFFSDESAVALLLDEAGAVLAGAVPEGAEADFSATPAASFAHAGRRVRLALVARPQEAEPVEPEPVPPVEDVSPAEPEEQPVSEAAPEPAPSEPAVSDAEALDETPSEASPQLGQTPDASPWPPPIPPRIAVRRAEPARPAARRGEPRPEDLPAPRIMAGRVARELKRQPVRFLWQTDAAGRVLFVSPGLAQVVGRNAEVVGERWEDASIRLGLDPTGRIARALRNRDTWSGQTAWWPVEGSGVRVPAELTALPVFSVDHAFQGYRGFGVLRPADALMPAAYEARFGAPDAAAPAEPPPPEEEAASAAPANVVPIRADLERMADHARLTPQERNAFDEIAAALRDRVLLEPAETFLKDAPESETVPSETAEREEPAEEEIESEAPGTEAEAEIETDGAREAPPPVEAELEAEDELDAAAAAPAVDDDEDDEDEEALREALPERREPRVVWVARPEGAAVPAPPRRASPKRRGAPEEPAARTADATEDNLREPDAKAPTAPPAAEIPVEARAEPEPEKAIEPRAEADDFDAPADESPFAPETEAEEPLAPEEPPTPPAEESEPPHAAEAPPPPEPVPPRQPVPLAPELPEVQRRLREMTAILDTATDGVLLLSTDGVIESVNASAEALFGLDAHEIEGRPLADLLTPETRQAALDYLSGLADSGVASLLNEGREVEALAGSGSIPIFMTMGRIAADEGARYCAVLRDITHWKRIEAELTAAKRAAEEASSQKSEFLARVSHEIRTPLNAIIGFAEVMIEERFGPVENERYREYLRDIRTSGEHVVSLVNDLLDISKIEAGKLDLTFTAVPLNELVRECIALMQPQASRAHVVLRSSLSREVPAVVADERTLRQIVLNLLSNSVKFTGPGGQVIASTSLADSGEALLRVRDTGEGMSEDELARALEPFRQLSTATIAGRAGTGLGLPLTKALVEANRATLSIKSARGEGTVVTVTIPPTRVLSE